MPFLPTFSRANRSIKAEKWCGVVGRGRREAALQPLDQQGHLIALCIKWQLPASRLKNITVIDKCWMGTDSERKGLRQGASRYVAFFLKINKSLIQHGCYSQSQPSGKSIFNTFCSSHCDFGFLPPLIKEKRD